jgi:type IV secretion system protein TrbL
MLRFTEIAWGFIEKISVAIGTVQPYAQKLLYVLITINIAWTGIETILGKNDLAKIIEKVFLTGVTVLLVTRFVEISHIFLASVVKLAGISTGMDQNLLENPTQIFEFAHVNILEPYGAAIEATLKANSEGNPLQVIINFFQSIRFTVMFGIFTLCIYICFAVVVVQIMLNYILYHINLFFGVILLPFTAFKPFEFIGKNVFKAVFTQALTCAVIIFIASLGMEVFRGYFTAAAVRMQIERGLTIGHQWVVIASILLYAFLCLMAPTLVMSIMSGAPTLGASGLISTVAGIGAGIGGAIAGAAAAGSQGSGTQANSTGGSNTTVTQGQNSTGTAPATPVFNAASSSSTAGTANDFSKAGEKQEAAEGRFLPSEGTASSAAYISPPRAAPASVPAPVTVQRG